MVSGKGRFFEPGAAEPRERGARSLRVLAETATAVLLAMFLSLTGCGTREKISALGQLEEKTFAVVSGTAADQLVLSRFPKAKLTYYNTVLDACMAVKAGKADAAGYDEPILKNIAAKNPGLTVLPEKLTNDSYGFAVSPGNRPLKEDIDSVVAAMKRDGSYEAMLRRWLPESGQPAPMPEIPSSGENGVLKLGTAAVTEPFAFVDGSGKIVGLDIELARRVARRRGMNLEILNMDFGAMIPALIAGKVDMIASCITITEERAKRVLFSEPYYTGGISALVRE